MSDMKISTAPILALALCSCVVVFPPDDDGGGESSSTSGSGDESSSDESSSTYAATDTTTGELGTSSEGGGESSTGSETTDGTTSETTGGGCFTQPRPYGACDPTCGEEACDGGRTCIGDPITGEAACADPCEGPVDCPADIYPEPWVTPVCQPAPSSGIAGSWCGIACAEGVCPNITVCTDLGGTQPLCVGEA